MLTPRLRRFLVASLSFAVLSGCSSDSDVTAAPTVTDASDASPELASVIADANRMAPALESEVRGMDYPTTLDGAKQALTASKIEPTGGNVVDGYEYDPDTVEFRLCIEGPTGAFAIYDTQPMSLFEAGETGGCPAM